MLEGWFKQIAGNSADAYLAAKWAFGDGFEEYYGSHFIEAWNTRHGDECFFMNDADDVCESVKKIVNAWREKQGMRKVNKNIAKAHKTPSKVLAVEPARLPVAAHQTTPAVSPLEGRVAKLEKDSERFHKLMGMASVSFEAMADALEEIDKDMSKTVKMVTSLSKAVMKLGGETAKDAQLNHKLTQKVKLMATDIDKIKSRMQVASKKVDKMKPKVAAKVAKAHTKANAKLPKSFGKVR